MNASEVKLSYVRKSSGIIIKGSQDAAVALLNYWDMDTIDYHESFVVMYLSRKNEVLGVMNVTIGSFESCIVDARKIFQGALLTNSASIIISHNHPSGNTKPSTQDLSATKKLQNAGEYLNIRVLDHLIVTSNGYYSMADEGNI